MPCAPCDNGDLIVKSYEFILGILLRIPDYFVFRATK